MLFCHSSITPRWSLSAGKPWQPSRGTPCCEKRGTPHVHTRTELSLKVGWSARESDRTLCGEHYSGVKMWRCDTMQTVQLKHAIGDTNRGCPTCMCNQTVPWRLSWATRKFTMPVLCLSSPTGQPSAQIANHKQHESLIVCKSKIKHFDKITSLPLPLPSPSAFLSILFSAWVVYLVCWLND